MEERKIFSEVKCGDVVWAKIPKSEDPNSQVQSGWRPVLILGNPKGVKYSPVVQYVPITSQLKRTDLPIHVLIAGLDKDSMCLAEQIGTIDKHNIRNKICTLSKETMTQIKAALLFQLFVEPDDEDVVEAYNNILDTVYNKRKSYAMA
jgi:mRNA interferase MazF